MRISNYRHQNETKPIFIMPSSFLSEIFTFTFVEDYIKSSSTASDENLKRIQVLLSLELSYDCNILRILFSYADFYFASSTCIVSLKKLFFTHCFVL